MVYNTFACIGTCFIYPTPYSRSGSKKPLDDATIYIGILSVNEYFVICNKFSIVYTLPQLALELKTLSSTNKYLPKSPLLFFINAQNSSAKQVPIDATRVSE